MNNDNIFINSMREPVRADADPVEGQEVLEDRRISEYDRRSAEIVKGWERAADRRKAAEAKLPKTTAEDRGHMAYVNYKNNVNELREAGII